MEVKVLGPVALNNGAGQIDIGGPASSACWLPSP